MINRISSTESIKLIDTGDIPVMSYIYSDEKLAEADLKGESILTLPADTELLRGTERALVRMVIL